MSNFFLYNKSFFFRPRQKAEREREGEKERERDFGGPQDFGGREEGAEFDARLKGEPPGSPWKKGRRTKESGVQ